MPDVTPLVTVPGTWAADGAQWWHDSSSWWRYMRRRGFDAAHQVSEMLTAPFEWETNLGSSWYFWRHWWPGEDEVKNWRYAGKALGYYLDALPVEERIVIAHSHGGQVALHAATVTPITRLVTLGTPLRHDVMDAVGGRAGVKEWWHVCDRSKDWIAFFGAVGDGRIDRDRKHPTADQNVLIPGIGHSRLLNEPAVYHVWDDQLLCAFLHGEGE